MTVNPHLRPGQGQVAVPGVFAQDRFALALAVADAGSVVDACWALSETHNRQHFPVTLNQNIGHDERNAYEAWAPWTVFSEQKSVLKVNFQRAATPTSAPMEVKLQ